MGIGNPVQFFSRRIFLFVPVLLCLFQLTACAQTEATVKRSKKTEFVEGKKYYLHTVEKGQTLYSIAKAYDLTVNDIIVENPDAMNGIKPGQVLRIPAQKPVQQTTAPDTTFFIHKVEAGQTLYSIAHKYNVTEEAIIKLNPEAKSGIRIGQELKIPGKSPAIGIPVIAPVAGDTLYRGIKKAEYNVAFMLPLQLWNVENINTDLVISGKEQLNPKMEAAIQFYQGAMLAVDSMRRRGMKVNIRVYDMDDGDSAKVQSILDKPEFANTDLIIGPLSPGPFYVASQWAKDHHVAIVSPVSPANRVLFHRPESSKALPSTSTQMEELADHIAAAHPKDNVVLITNGNPKETAAANVFRNRMNELLFPGGTDSIATTKTFSGLEALLKKDKTNIIVIPANGQAYVTEMMRLIHGLADKYPIIVYGMPSWMTFENLDFEYLEIVQFHFVSPWFVDSDSSASVKRFLDQYDKTYGGPADSYVFAGYDVTLFFLSALFDYGTDFYLKLSEIKADGLQQRFEFVRSDPESGFENRGVRIVRMKEYRLSEVK
jgi:LysM repeat protein/ABC-type branched-subunit amino acid transport system substrate-binding protein